MRYIAELTTAEKYTLNEAYHKHPKFSVRQRAQALLWNAQGYTITQVYKLLDVRRETMSAWFDRWESLGIVGLFDEHRSGRPSIFNPEEQVQFLALIDENPHQPKKAAVQLLEQTGKESSFTTFRRVLKRNLYSWKRCRRTLKNQRNELLFRKEQALQVFLRQQEIDGNINLIYYDESGFSTVPSIPYAWTPKNETQLLDSKNCKRLNILGFMNRKNELFTCSVEHTVTSEDVIRAFDLFAASRAIEYAKTKTPQIVILDNASVHRSKAFRSHIVDWRKQGIYLHFLPPYSPEHNIIEILWRKVKYEWLPLNIYKSYNIMKETVNEILANVGIGNKFSITFA